MCLWPFLVCKLDHRRRPGENYFFFFFGGGGGGGANNLGKKYHKISTEIRSMIQGLLMLIDLTDVKFLYKRLSPWIQNTKELLHIQRGTNNNIHWHLETRGVTRCPKKVSGCCHECSTQRTRIWNEYYGNCHGIKALAQGHNIPYINLYARSFASSFTLQREQVWQKMWNTKELMKCDFGTKKSADIDRIQGTIQRPKQV